MRPVMELSLSVAVVNTQPAPLQASQMTETQEAQPLGASTQCHVDALERARARRALETAARRANLGDWTIMPSADPLRFWKAMNELAGRP